MHLEGPMQSWGGPVAGSDRPTLDAPTKSGVIGLVAGAMGIFRDDPHRVADLHARLLFAVREDRGGTLGRDFHTTAGVMNSRGRVSENVVLSRRAYLYGAAFTALLVAADSTDVLLDDLLASLRHPQVPPFLGRRACVSSTRLLASDRVLEGGSVEELFAQVPLSETAAGSRDSEFPITADEMLLAGRGHAPHVQRDVALGNVSRLFDERVLLRARVAAPTRPLERVIDGWMP